MKVTEALQTFKKYFDINENDVNKFFYNPGTPGTYGQSSYTKLILSLDLPPLLRIDKNLGGGLGNRHVIVNVPNKNYLISYRFEKIEEWERHTISCIELDDTSFNLLMGDNVPSRQELKRLTDETLSYWGMSYPKTFIPIYRLAELGVVRRVYAPHCEAYEVTEVLNG